MLLGAISLSPSSLKEYKTDPSDVYFVCSPNQFKRLTQNVDNRYDLQDEEFASG